MSEVGTPSGNSARNEFANSCCSRYALVEHIKYTRNYESATSHAPLRIRNFSNIFYMHQKGRDNKNIIHLWVTFVAFGMLKQSSAVQDAKTANTSARGLANASKAQPGANPAPEGRQERRTSSGTRPREPEHPRQGARERAKQMFAVTKFIRIETTNRESYTVMTTASKLASR